MAKQTNLSLGNFNVNIQEIRNAFVEITKNAPYYNDLRIILEVGLNNLCLFPNIRLSEGATHVDYLEK